MQTQGFKAGNFHTHKIIKLGGGKKAQLFCSSNEIRKNDVFVQFFRL